MTYKFIQKVLHYGLVDTQNYRYTSSSRHTTHKDGSISEWPIILRLPLSSLNTTDAINGCHEVWSGLTDSCTPLKSYLKGTK